MLVDDLLAAVNEPISTPPMFKVGQTVRVLKHIPDDGQTPLYWGGAKGECINIKVIGTLSKRWLYEVEHPNGSICEFTESELDARFSLE